MQPTSTTVTSRFLRRSKWCDALSDQRTHARCVEVCEHVRAERSSWVHASTACPQKLFVTLTMSMACDLPPPSCSYRCCPSFSACMRSKHAAQILLQCSHPLPTPTLPLAGHRHMHGRSDQHPGCVGARYRCEVTRIMSTAVCPAMSAFLTVSTWALLAANGYATRHAVAAHRRCAYYPQRRRSRFRGRHPVSGHQPAPAGHEGGVRAAGRVGLRDGVRSGSAAGAG